jgi:heat shock transcription factor
MDEKEVEELVAAAAATEAAPEPWAEMDDKEVEELVQQIDCIGSPSP